MGWVFMLDESLEKTLIERGFKDCELRYFRQTIYDKPLLLSIRKKLEFNKNKRCLDIGCGIGILERSSQQLVNLEFVGLDVNKKYLLFAKSISPANDFVVADARFLPFQKGSFDSIVVHDVFFGMKISELLSSFFEILSKGGDFYFDLPNFWFFHRFPQYSPFVGSLSYDIKQIFETLDKIGLEIKSKDLAPPISNTRQKFGFLAELIQSFETVSRCFPRFFREFLCNFWYLILIHCKKSGT
jgi:SAM-dependent methyltransferase